MPKFYARSDVADDREPTTDAGWYPDLSFSANSWGFLYATQSCALTFSRSKRNQDEQFASGAIGSLIGKPVRVRHGPATVIVEGWPKCH
jgi:hypothetical protein